MTNAERALEIAGTLALVASQIIHAGTASAPDGVVSNLRFARMYAERVLEDITEWENEI